MCRVYYTTIERLRNYINDARFLYPSILHTIKFIIYLFMIATFPLKKITITKLVNSYYIIFDV